MDITLVNVQYKPNSDTSGAVGLCMQGPAPFGTFLRASSQSALQARAPEGVPWSDAEALAEAQSIVSAEFPEQGFTVVLPAAA